MTADPLPTLMVLRVKGRASAPAIAAATGVAERTAQEALDELCADGTARLIAARSEAELTDAGRMELTRRLAAEGSGVRDAIAALYPRFLEVDRGVKEAITAWQLARLPTAPTGGSPSGARPGGSTPTSPTTRLRKEVDAVAERAHGLATSLGAIAPRFLAYDTRLDAARAAVARGDDRFVASPFVDSLHQVWFELHEDLLVTLGRTRSS